MTGDAPHPQQTTAFNHWSSSPFEVMTGDAPHPQQATERTSLEFHRPVSGGRWAPGIETVGSRSTGAAKRRPGGVPTSAAQSLLRRVPERSLRRRRLYLEVCLEELERFRNADDPILRDNAFAKMKGQLQSLWEAVEGNPDSEAFEEIVNVLQVALHDVNSESLGADQLDAISSVLMKLHDDPDLDDQSANDMTSELIRSGIDVFREIG